MDSTGSTIKLNKIARQRAQEIANTFEWLIIAFVLAFVFRAFVMEPFRIPTGSMANTLRGDHFKLRCTQCGYKYERGFEPEAYNYDEDYIPTAPIQPSPSKCPSCGFLQLIENAMPVANGDRILVLKCGYLFNEPERWDVVVFRNPLEPHVNFIKRLIAKPGETVEIIDGDIYINNLIARKPENVQDDLWIPVYNNDYQPVNPDSESFNGHRWKSPFVNIENSKWQINAKNPTALFLDSQPDEKNMLVYDTSIGNNFKSYNTYNEVKYQQVRPDCSDLMVNLNTTFNTDCSNSIGIELTKYQTAYIANLTSEGMMTISSRFGESETILESRKVSLPDDLKSIFIRFANVDHQLIFQAGSNKIYFDLGRSPFDIGPMDRYIEPKIKITGSGKLSISNIAIFRDIHYTSSKYGNSVTKGQAVEGYSMQLGKDEFFVLGDNSPNSEDSRWWRRMGIGNNATNYAVGTVPKDYLVGKAFLVYWPSGYETSGSQRLQSFLEKKAQSSGLIKAIQTLISINWIPDFDKIRFIHGGNSEDL